jgi:hypothetical protein
MAIFNSYVSLPEGMYPTVHLHTMAYIICVYASILWTSVCDNSTVQNYIYIYMVGGFKHFLFSIIIWDNSSHWLSCFSRWLKPPTRYGGKSTSIYNIYDNCMYIYNIYIYGYWLYIYINTHHFLKLGGALALPACAGGLPCQLKRPHDGTEAHAGAFSGSWWRPNNGCIDILIYHIVTGCKYHPLAQGLPLTNI